MAITDRNGLPIALSTHSASPHEVTLVEATLSRRFIRNKPKTIIADKAYDSDNLDILLKKKGIELIAPHKRNRKKKKTQDGRKLRRYRNRWKIERFFVWLQTYRRCQTRYDYYILRKRSFLGFLQLSCMLI